MMPGAPMKEDNYDDPEYQPIGIESKEKLLSMWKSTLKILDRFWEMWHNEYLNSLRERQQINTKDQDYKRTRFQCWER